MTPLDLQTFPDTQREDWRLRGRAWVHKMASVPKGVTLGAGTHVGPSVRISKGARLGRDVIVHDCVFIGTRVRIGSSTTIGVYAPLRINCQSFPLQVTGPTTIRIGCTSLSIGTWRRSGESRARARRFDDDLIAEYREYFEFAVRWIALNSDRIGHAPKPKRKKKKKKKKAATKPSDG